MDLQTMRVLIFTNLFGQIALVVAMIVSWYLVRKERQLKRHCLMMRVAVGLQIAAIAGIMGPALSRVSGVPAPLIRAHVALGDVVIGLFIYINLAYSGTIRTRFPIRYLMRPALASWLTGLGLGMYLFSILGQARFA
jgi:hypothetical protein